MVKVNKVQKKKETEIEMHQHMDINGRIFGSLHPTAAKHQNKNTQKRHDLTLELTSNPERIMK